MLVLSHLVELIDKMTNEGIIPMLSFRINSNKKVLKKH